MHMILMKLRASYMMIILGHCLPFSLVFQCVFDERAVCKCRLPAHAFLPIRILSCTFSHSSRVHQKTSFAFAYVVLL